MSTSGPESEAASIDRRSADIGIVCTQALEIQPLLKSLDRVRRYSDGGVIFRGGFLRESIRVAVVEAGAGFAVHRRAATTLIDEHHPVWVLSVGFSSPLTDELHHGDVCLANAIADTHGNRMDVRCPIPESKRIYVRPHVVADQHPTTADQRRQLAEQWSGAAVDTTSLAVAQACAEVQNEKPKARFLSIRGIVGDAADELTSDVVEAIFAPDREARPAGLSSLWTKVRPPRPVAEWKKRSEDTAAHLSRFTLSVIEQLAEKLGKY
ncbi:MAG: hypothetical protein Fues2KO_47900 [Fuerstiella sp.]